MQSSAEQMEHSTEFASRRCNFDWLTSGSRAPRFCSVLVLCEEARRRRGTVAYLYESSSYTAVRALVVPLCPPFAPDGPLVGRGLLAHHLTTPGAVEKKGRRPVFIALATGGASRPRHLDAQRMSHGILDPRHPQARTWSSAPGRQAFRGCEGNVAAPSRLCVDRF